MFSARDKALVSKIFLFSLCVCVWVGIWLGIARLWTHPPYPTPCIGLVHIYTYLSLSIYIYIYIYIYMCVCVYIYMCVYIYIYVCVCVCVCMYIYVYAYIFLVDSLPPLPRGSPDNTSTHRSRYFCALFLGSTLLCCRWELGWALPGSGLSRLGLNTILSSPILYGVRHTTGGSVGGA